MHRKSEIINLKIIKNVIELFFVVNIFKNCKKSCNHKNL